MKLWNKTILAAAITLLIAVCDDADKKVDSNLNQTKTASQIKDAAAKASSIKYEADKHIDAVKQGSRISKQINSLKRQNPSKAEADAKSTILLIRLKRKEMKLKADAKQKAIKW